MKVTADSFSSFLKSASLNGSVKELFISFLSDGLHSNTLNIPKTLMMDGFLNKKEFADYEELGTLGLSDSSLIVKFLGKRQEDVFISVDNGTLMISTLNNTFKLKLLAEIVASEHSIPELAIIANFKLEASDLKELRDSFKESDNGEIKICITDVHATLVVENSLASIEKITKGYSQQQINTTIGDPFFELIKSFDTDIDFGICDNKLVSFKTDNFMGILAPLVKNSD